MSLSPPEWRSLLPALLDFERTPGRFPVALREPRPLFAHMGSVVLLAAGRPVPGMPAAAPMEQELRRAARFFVRTVMLRPGTDPFTLLGLQPDFEPAQLREHYRLMMRLTHPDFGAAGERWPADAATRVNQARQLLASPETRAGCAAALLAPAHLLPAALQDAPLRQRLLAWPSLPPEQPHEPTRAQALAQDWLARTRAAVAHARMQLLARARQLIGPRAPPAPDHAPPRTGERR